MIDRPIQYVFEGSTLPSATFNEHPELTDRLFERGILVSQPSGGSTVRFVGLVVCDQLTLVILPKIELTINLSEVQRQTLRALRAYSRWKPNYHEPTPYLNTSPDLGEVSGIAIFDWLMTDFLEYGLYRRTNTEAVVNGLGTTNWNATVGRLKPIFSNGSTIYLDTINRKTENDGSNFATMMHLHLLELFSKKFASIIDYEPVILDHEPVSRFDVIPDVEECEAKLLNEMREVFSDRGQQLLTMMIAAIKSEKIERDRGLSLYGTNSFHNVWEAACSHLCGNELEKWIVELPTPLWISGDMTQNADTFRPDVVCPLLAKSLLIADAKYYRPSMPPALSRVPSVNDVAKQIWYKQYLAGPAKRRGFDCIENIFLFPGVNGSSFDPLLYHIGAVEFPAGKERVEAIKLDFLKALQAYSDRSNRFQQKFKLELADMLMEMESQHLPDDLA